MLTAMSKSRSDALLKIDGLSVPIKVHVLKLLLARTSSYRNHWCKEVSQWYFQIYQIRLKPRNSAVTASLLKDANLLDLRSEDCGETLSHHDLDDYVPDTVRTHSEFVSMASSLREDYQRVLYGMAALVLNPETLLTARDFKAKLQELLP